PRFADVGLSLSGIILWQRLMSQFAARFRDLQYSLGTLQDRELDRIADVGWLVLARLRQRQNSSYLIAHVAEAARLRTVAVNRKVFAAQRLVHEVRNHPAIVDL